MTLKQDLQSLQREIKTLERKMEKLIKEFDKGKKAKITKKVTAKPVKAKTTKRVPTKKASAKKKTQKLTATDKVLKIIMGRKRGVDASTIMAKTGFNQKKIWAILLRAYKTGKIKRIVRGVYVGA